MELLDAWSASGIGDANATELAKIAEDHHISVPVKTNRGEPFDYNVRSLGKYLAGFAGRVFELSTGAEVTLQKSTKKGKNGVPWTLHPKAA
jgi:hypothetical protein